MATKIHIFFQSDAFSPNKQRLIWLNYNHIYIDVNPNNFLIRGEDLLKGKRINLGFVRNKMQLVQCNTNSLHTIHKPAAILCIWLSMTVNIFYFSWQDRPT